LIRHAFFRGRGGDPGAAALPVAALAIAMILTALGTGLMTAVGCARLLAPRLPAAKLGTVAMSAIASAADGEDPAAGAGQEEDLVVVVVCRQWRGPKALDNSDNTSYVSR